MRKQAREKAECLELLKQNQELKAKYNELKAGLEVAGVLVKELQEQQQELVNFLNSLKKN